MRCDRRNLRSLSALQHGESRNSPECTNLTACALCSAGARQGYGKEAGAGLSGAREAKAIGRSLNRTSGAIILARNGEFVALLVVSAAAPRCPGRIRRVAKFAPQASRALKRFANNAARRLTIERNLATRLWRARLNRLEIGPGVTAHSRPPMHPSTLRGPATTFALLRIALFVLTNFRRPSHPPTKALAFAAYLIT